MIVVAAGAAAFLFASCGLVPQPGVGATFEPGVEHMPAPGLAHMSGDPDLAPRDLTLESFGQDGGKFPVSDAVAAGAVIEGSFWSNPGPHRVAVNGSTCEGEFPIAGDRMTEVLIHLTAGGCRAEVTDVKPIPNR